MHSDGLDDPSPMFRQECHSSSGGGGRYVNDGKDLRVARSPESGASIGGGYCGGMWSIEKAIQNCYRTRASLLAIRASQRLLAGHPRNKK